jgi:hypothetical protein
LVIRIVALAVAEELAALPDAITEASPNADGYTAWVPPSILQHAEGHVLVFGSSVSAVRFLSVNYWQKETKRDETKARKWWVLLGFVVWRWLVSGY